MTTLRRFPARFLLSFGLAAMALAAVAALATAAPSRSQAAPQNTSPPTLEGTFREGQTITLSNGTYSNNPTSFSYRFQRCDAQGANCQNISGADQRTYTLVAADVGRKLRGIVTATNADGSTTTNSAPSPTVSGNAPPQNTDRPSVSGTPTVGETLTADTGTFSNGPESYSYQWQRCDANGGNCKDIEGARGKTYGVRTADVGSTLRVRVTARNSLGNDTATSDRTSVVKASGGSSTTTGATTTAAPQGGLTKLPSGVTSITIDAVALPNRLIVDRIQYTPTVIRDRNTPIVARFHVVESHGYSVNGALVYATGVPFGRISNAPEARTSPEGWAEITFRPTAQLPLKAGSLLVIFVRARKSGESVLAGVSTRRLVSARIGR